MTAPASLSRIKAALRRISPVWPSTATDTSVGKELDSIATAIGTAADPLDDALDEVFPDTTDQLIDRWEAVTRVPTRTTDALATRRTRVLSVFRRLSGPRLDQLEAMLAGPLDLNTDDILFVEPLRQFIEDALTVTDTTDYALTSTPTYVQLGRPWPGVVDDTGVTIYLERNNAVGTPDFTLTSPAGTVWVIPFSGTSGTYSTRTDFLGEAAGGRWTLTASTAGAATSLIETHLLVSNDIDAAQIYNFFALRDADLAGTPDITEAQRLFHRTALGHMNAHVIERLEHIVDDTHSKCDREPVGP